MRRGRGAVIAYRTGLRLQETCVTRATSQINFWFFIVHLRMCKHKSNMLIIMKIYCKKKLFCFCYLNKDLVSIRMGKPSSKESTSMHQMTAGQHESFCSLLYMYQDNHLSRVCSSTVPPTTVQKGWIFPEMSKPTFELKVMLIRNLVQAESLTTYKR